MRWYLIPIAQWLGYYIGCLVGIICYREHFIDGEWMVLEGANESSAKLEGPEKEA